MTRFSWRNRFRIEFAPERHGVRDAVHFGRYNYAKAGPALTMHSHPRAMELCFLIRGRQTYRVAGHDHHLRGGDVFVTFPDESHSTGGAPEEKGILYWLIIELRGRRNSLLGLSAAEARVLHDALQRLPQRVFRGRAGMEEHLDAIVQLHLVGGGPLNDLAMRNRILALLLEVIAAADDKTLAPREPAANLGRVTAFIDSQLEAPVSIAAMARKAGLSVPRFKVWFREQTGVPPGEYHLRHRVEEARRRLAAGKETVTAVAYDLGFSSSQYFATVMKRYTGKTPRELQYQDGTS